jgi:hypothetical protein
VHKDRSQGIEGLNNGIEDVFVSRIVIRQLRLPRQWKIGIFPHLVQKVMMVSMVPPKRDGRRQSHRDVAHDSKQFIYGHIAPSAEMHEIVNAAVQGMAEEAAHKISVQQNEPHWHFLSIEFYTFVR